MLQFKQMIVRCFVIICVYAFSASFSYAERYSVERDRFGNYSAKKVDKDIQPEKLAGSKEVTSTDALQVNQSALSIAVDANYSEDEPALIKDHDAADLSKFEPESEQVAPKKLSVFEQKYLEAERIEQQRILNALTKGKNVASDYDATAVNPEDFIDSETLLRSSSKVDAEKSPYYVTVEADGTPRTVFYDPTLVKEIIFKERNPKLEFTKSDVYQRSDSTIAVPEGADPVAINILSAGKNRFESYFDNFSRRCCEQLPNIEIPQISQGNYFYFVLNDDNLSYRFSEGDSRFLLFALPELTKTDVQLRIRTFIRKSPKKNVEKGVFFPQLVTLDKDKKPLRIFTNPHLKYVDETWTTYAYLQGHFPLSQTRALDERYVLINTTRQLLTSRSTIEISSDYGAQSRKVVLEHMNEGSFEIEILQ